MEVGMTVSQGGTIWPAHSPFERPHPHFWWKPEVSNDPYQLRLMRLWATYRDAWRREGSA